MLVLEIIELATIVAASGVQFCLSWRNLNTRFRAAGPV